MGHREAAVLLFSRPLGTNRWANTNKSINNASLCGRLSACRFWSFYASDFRRESPLRFLWMERQRCPRASNGWSCIWSHVAFGNIPFGGDSAGQESGGPRALTTWDRKETPERRRLGDDPAPHRVHLLNGSLSEEEDRVRVVISSRFKLLVFVVFFRQLEWNWMCRRMCFPVETQVGTASETRSVVIPVHNGHLRQDTSCFRRFAIAVWTQHVPNHRLKCGFFSS